MRDAKITQLYEGTQQIQRLVIARALLGSRRSPSIASTPREVPTPCASSSSTSLCRTPPPGGERLRPDAGSTARPPRRRQRQRRIRPRGGAQAHRGPRRRGPPVSMARPTPPETMRKALAMGATSGSSSPTPRSRARTPCPRRVSWRRRSRRRVRPRPRRGRHLRRRAGVVPAGVATLLGLPYLSCAARSSRTPPPERVRVHRITPTGYDVLEAPMPALVVGTQALGEPRYPSLKGIMAARSKSIKTLSLADVRSSLRRSAARSRPRRSSDAEAPPPRAATRSSAEPAADAAAPGRRLPGRAEDHLMAGEIWVRGELAPDGSLAKISHRGGHARPDPRRGRRSGRRRGRRRRRAGRRGRRARPVRPAGPRPDRAGDGRARRGHDVGQRLAALIEHDQPSSLLVGAGPEGRDVAGVVSALTGWGVLVNAVGVTWDDGPLVEMSVFGGKLTTTCRPTGGHTIVTVRPNVVTAEPAAAAGTVEPRDVAGGSTCRRSPSSIASRRPASPPRSRRPGSSSPAVAESAGRTGSAVARARRRARRRRRRDPGRGRLGLDPVRPADRPDRQDRQARSCTSPSASPARSSTRSGCRRRGRSSP